MASTHDSPRYEYRAFQRPLPDDDDYDYDTFLYYPSSWPNVLFTENLDFADALVVPSGSSELSQLLSVPDPIPQDTQLTLPIPPSESVDDDIGIAHFAEADERGLGGYSRLFKAGFLSSSRQFTRNIDRIMRVIQNGIRSTKRRLSL
ncbi:hypothetical protein NLI96_g5225 [Meripilus lineatus]|uniref:Uncharacterized protein n=1 Tax=Meripilus lineatus TaxID=2056292 RepID=A0AAD5V5G2_9APHY|nr:hypothetical protein NLI96_g5225 [Physisporinus lineatus]